MPNHRLPGYAGDPSPHCRRRMSASVRARPYTDITEPSTTVGGAPDPITAAGGTPPPPSDDPDAIRADIERTREQLGDSVEAMAAKTDVKARARQRLAAAKDRARQAAQDAGDRAKATAQQTGQTVRQRPARPRAFSLPSRPHSGPWYWAAAVGRPRPAPPGGGGPGKRPAGQAHCDGGAEVAPVHPSGRRSSPPRRRRADSPRQGAPLTAVKHGGSSPAHPDAIGADQQPTTLGRRSGLSSPVQREVRRQDRCQFVDRPGSLTRAASVRPRRLRCTPVRRRRAGR
jgi:ElaB/YqjD/DUF883 family membrane-anchored ribosome-binding protein